MKVQEKYEAPEVEFVEMGEDVIVASGGDGLCTGGRGAVENND